MPINTIFQRPASLHPAMQELRLIGAQVLYKKKYFEKVPKKVFSLIFLPLHVLKLAMLLLKNQVPLIYLRINILYSNHTTCPPPPSPHPLLSFLGALQRLLNMLENTSVNAH